MRHRKTNDKIEIVTGLIVASDRRIIITPRRVNPVVETGISLDVRRHLFKHILCEKAILETKIYGFGFFYAFFFLQNAKHAFISV